MTDKNYFEDFAQGQVYAHCRGRTFSQEENTRWSLQTMNTAQAHWNFESMRSYMDGAFDRPLMNAAIVLAICVGLTSQDMSEQIIADLGIDALRIPVPSFPGDTVMVTSTVLETSNDPERLDAGILRYGVAGKNQRGDVICTFERSVAVKRRSAWAHKDAEASNSIWNT